MKNKPLLHALGHALLVLLYVYGVATLMTSMEKRPGLDHNLGVPIAMLLLFVLSAAIVGALILGRPILMYLDGAKKQALAFFGYTLGWLFVITIIAFLFLTQ